VAGISVFFICTSVISFCLKTLPGLRVEIPLTLNHTSSNLSDIYQHLTASTTEANFITTTTAQRSFHGAGLFNRYSVRAENCCELVCSHRLSPRRNFFMQKIHQILPRLALHVALLLFHYNAQNAGET
jgi:hypothetical protein